jgi:hypothetical protein
MIGIPDLSSSIGLPGPTGFPAIQRWRGGIIHASIVSRRSWSLDHFNDSSFPRAEDRELWVGTHHRSRFGKIPEPLYLVRDVGEPVISIHPLSHDTRFFVRSQSKPHEKILIFRSLIRFAAPKSKSKETI